MMQIANDFTALTTDLVWQDAAGAVRTEITYGFATETYDHHRPATTPGMRMAVTPLTNAEKAVARAGFQSWESVTIIDFTEIAADNADIIVTVTDFTSDPDLDDTLGFAFQPEGEDLSGDVFIDAPFSESLPLYIHEIGHSLGLDHSFDGARIFGDLTLDRIENTIMGEADYDAATGPGAFDIQAIAAMYGPAPTEPPQGQGGGGADALVGDGGADDLSGLGGADTLSGLGGADNLSGGGGRDVLNGGAGRDVLDGGGGRDQVNGDGGRDDLIGGNGRDILNGGGGKDTLDGGRGRDDLTGGRGADTFYFDAPGPRDRIKDFQFDIDAIQIDGAAGFDDLQILDLAAGALIRFDGIRVLVEDVAADDLIADDFIF